MDNIIQINSAPCSCPACQLMISVKSLNSSLTQSQIEILFWMIVVGLITITLIVIYSCFIAKYVKNRKACYHHINHANGALL
ncbi:hypothetical protein [Mycoplasmopsis adleri]|uniref:hypothetical protein n=1 Tax=Mycoplasmopsis adleri TaxID=51362 RepID=UPI0038735194